MTNSVQVPGFAWVCVDKGSHCACRFQAWLGCALTRALTAHAGSRLRRCMRRQGLSLRMWVPGFADACVDNGSHCASPCRFQASQMCASTRALTARSEITWCRFWASLPTARPWEGQATALSLQFTVTSLVAFFATLNGVGLLRCRASPLTLSSRRRLMSTAPLRTRVSHPHTWRTSLGWPVTSLPVSSSRSELVSACRSWWSPASQGLSRLSC